MEFIFARAVDGVVATGLSAGRCHEKRRARGASGSALRVCVRVSEGQV